MVIIKFDKNIHSFYPELKISWIWIIDVLKKLQLELRLNFKFLRYYLLLFYWICIFASLIFCIIVNHSSHSSTIHRKFFHLTVSLICITGIQYDFELIWLFAWLMLCIFVIIEVSLLFEFSVKNYDF